MAPQKNTNLFHLHQLNGATRMVNEPALFDQETVSRREGVLTDGMKNGRQVSMTFSEDIVFSAKAATGGHPLGVMVDVVSGPGTHFVTDHNASHTVLAVTLTSNICVHYLDPVFSKVQPRPDTTKVSCSGDVCYPQNSKLDHPIMACGDKNAPQQHRMYRLGEGESILLWDAYQRVAMITARRAGERPDVGSASLEIIGLHLAMKARQSGCDGSTVGWCRAVMREVLSDDTVLGEVCPV